MKPQKLKKGCDTCDIDDTSAFPVSSCRRCHIPLVGFIIYGSLFNFSEK